MSRTTKSRKASVDEHPLHVVILAAGQGTRMKSATPKVLHRIAGKPMLEHVLRTASRLNPAACQVVVGHRSDAIQAWYSSNSINGLEVQFKVQREQLGTAHAVAQAMPSVPSNAQVLILFGDVPLLEPSTLQAFLNEADGTLGVLTATADDPFGYGRILRSASGGLKAIVEEREATNSQKRITEINTGVMTAPADRLRRWLEMILDGEKQSREFYLPNVVQLAVRERCRVRSLQADSYAEIQGVNDRVQLAELERVWQRRNAQALLRQGVSLLDPERIDVRGSLLCGQDVTIDVGAVFEGEVELGDQVYIGPNCVLRDMKIGAGTRVGSHCVLESSIIGQRCEIGPYARLRPESRLANQVKVGNFVEIKKSTLATGAKANHLAYLGDATVGERVNVGAGVITCNYDGANKHRTTIGDDAFIGTDSQLIAPVTIGPRAYIAAGSSIARDAPPDALTICRERSQKSLDGWRRPVKKEK